MKKVKSAEIEKRWFSSKDAQAYLGMGKDFFDALRERAQIHYYKVGRCVFYEKCDLDNLILSNKVV